MKLTTLFLSSFSFQGRDKNRNIAFSIWLIITLFCFAQSLITHRYNNYLIFENTFRNLIHQSSFYIEYPSYHFDSNHYGPLFSVFFMPFALMPNGLGLFFWDIFNTIVLFKAIETLSVKNKASIYFIAIPCLVSSALSEQFNPAVGAFIILSYTLLNKNKGLWSTMLIVLGAFIKLYGIVGLAFFFFVKDKKRFILYLAMWSVFFFILPMLFSSPDFIIRSYQEWGISLLHKNDSNIIENSLDISIMGFIRNLFVGHNIPNLVFLLIGVLIFFIPYFNLKAYRSEKFQLLILGSVLLFPVLFSTGSEDCTYIIAISGVGLWYLTTERKIWKSVLLALTVLFSCNFPLLLFSKFSSQYPILYSMLSFPFFIVWLLMIMDASRLRTKELYE